MAMTENVSPRRGESTESTIELVKEAFDQARELTKLEVALAKNEVIAELRQLRMSAIVLGAGAVLAIVGVAVLLVALAFALGGGLAALVIGIVCLALAAACGASGVWLRPKRPLGMTKERVEHEVKQLKERVA